MKCVREIERLALCSANSQIVLRRSKAECDREGLHTPFFICLKLPLTLPCFCLAVHENYIIKDIWHIRGYIHCSELIIKTNKHKNSCFWRCKTNMTEHTKREKAVKIFC